MHQPLRCRSDVLRKTAERIIQELTRGVRKKAEVTLEGGSAAEHRIARAAIRTGAAGEPRVDVNTIAHGHVGDLTPDHRADVAREFPPYRSATAAQAHAVARSAWKRPSTSSCPPEEITFGIVAVAKGYGGWRL